MTIVIPRRAGTPRHLMFERRRLLLWPDMEIEETMLKNIGFKPWTGAARPTWSRRTDPADDFRAALCALAQHPAIVVTSTFDRDHLRRLHIPHIDGYQSEIDLQEAKNESMRRQLDALCRWVVDTALPRTDEDEV